MTPEHSPERRLHTSGGGRGEPLLLLHGIGLSLRTWDPLRPALERSHSALALDLPGFGESPTLPADTRPTVFALADAVERELDAEGLETMHIAGNSLGGWVALELGRRGRARSVVAISPAGMWSRREQSYVRTTLRLFHGFMRGIAPAAESMTRTAGGRVAALSGAMRRPWRLEAGDAAYLIRAFARAPGWDATLDATVSDQAKGLDQVRCPARIAWGSLDLLLFPRQARRFTRVIPHAELVSLDGLGHVPMSDDPALVASTISGFVARLAASPQAASA
jgi:pimeloyl-ACP methyl ester carboxylesterase